MNWLWWGLAIVSLAAPVGILTLDRALGVPARKSWRYWGFPSLIAFSLALIGAGVSGSGVAKLILFGVLSGILATAALDAVRLFGHHMLRAFPLDMPQLFGTIALGLAPRLQRNLIAEMVRHMSKAEPEQRRAMLAARMPAIAALAESMRAAVIGSMQEGLARLPEADRNVMMAAQMAAMAELPSEKRQTLMRSMDAASNGSAQSVYDQPRGLPKLPMRVIRGFMQRALPKTWKQAGVSPGKPLALGYLWHFGIGITFAITYNLLFGQGSWGLAFAWGMFVWAAMMISMPPMMPLIKFPWWFPILPLAAHLVMAIPIGYIALNYLGPAGEAASLLGALKAML